MPSQAMDYKKHHVNYLTASVRNNLAGQMDRDRVKLHALHGEGINIGKMNSTHKHCISVKLDIRSYWFTQMDLN